LRFKGAGWFKILNYNQSGFALENGKLILSKVGEIPIKLHRKIKGEVKGVIIKCERFGKWFAKYFQVEDEPGLMPKTERAIGIDCWDQTFPDRQRRGGRSRIRGSTRGRLSR